MSGPYPGFDPMDGCEERIELSRDNPCLTNRTADGWGRSADTLHTPAPDQER